MEQLEDNLFFSNAESSIHPHPIVSPRVMRLIVASGLIVALALPQSTHASIYLPCGIMRTSIDGEDPSLAHDVGTCTNSRIPYQPVRNHVGLPQTTAAAAPSPMLVASATSQCSLRACPPALRIPARQATSQPISNLQMRFARQL